MPGDSLPFTQRLARDNHWSAAHADAVVEEYQRFAFLAVVAEHPVTPSDAVDQAWHLHLLYTRDYWERFCPDVLGRALHHGPTEGGAAQGALFDEQYSRTRHSYYRWFGEHPPAAIWPEAAVRFDRDTQWVRVNRQDCHVVRRLLPQWATVRRGLRCLPHALWGALWDRLQPAARALLAALLSCGVAQAQDTRPDSLWDAYGNPFALSAGSFLLGFAVVTLIAVAASALRGRQLWLATTKGRGVGEQPNDLLETAMMFGGGSRVLAVALTALGEGGHMRVQKKNCVAEDTPADDAHPLIRELYELIAPRPIKAQELLGQAHQRLEPEIEKIRTALEERQLMIPDDQLPRWPHRLGYLVILGLAVPRVGFAIEASRDFGFLLVLAVAMMFANGIAHRIAWRHHRRFSEGGMAARREQEQMIARAPAGSLALPMTTAVLGITALKGTAMADIGVLIASTPGGAGGDGGCGGSGCGGGGCGG